MNNDNHSLPPLPSDSSKVPQKTAREIAIDYFQKHGDTGIRTVVLNKIDDNKLDYDDVSYIFNEEPRPYGTSISTTNFGLGTYDDTLNLMTRDIKFNPFIIDGILKTDTTNMLIGGSKSYKTWHMLRIALCVSHGLPWFGKATRKSKVLFINPELPHNEALSRVQAIAKELNIYELDSTYFKMITLYKKFIPAEEVMTAIEKLVIADKHELVLLDSIYRLYGDRMDENSNGDMSRLLARMDKMVSAPNSALLFSHHSPKGAQAGKLSIDVAAGAGVFGRHVATSIVTRRIEADADRFSLEFTCRLDRHQKSIGLIMNGPSAIIDDTFNKSELNGNNKFNNSVILDVLSTGNFTVSELQARVELEHEMSNTTFYRFWKTIKELPGVTCLSKKYTYTKPAN